MVAAAARRLQEARGRDAEHDTAGHHGPRPVAAEALDVAEDRVAVRALEVVAEVGDAGGRLVGELGRLVLALGAQVLADGAHVARDALRLLAGLRRAGVDLVADAVAGLAGCLLRLLLRLAGGLLGLAPRPRLTPGLAGVTGGGRSSYSRSSLSAREVKNPPPLPRAQIAMPRSRAPSGASVASRYRRRRHRVRLQRARHNASRPGALQAVGPRARNRTHHRAVCDRGGSARRRMASGRHHSMLLPPSGRRGGAAGVWRQAGCGPSSGRGGGGCSSRRREMGVVGCGGVGVATSSGGSGGGR